jgi:exopolysaccharide biosynthesis polyprenyl glycosylphosphotransferase
MSSVGETTVPGAAAADEPRAGVSALPKEIFAPTTSASIKRRGWLMRRMLLAADAVGLTLAFLITQILFVPGDGVGLLTRDSEFIVFFATVPLWLLIARVYRLYDRDEVRTDHTTVDDLVGVFHLVTVGTWLFFAATQLTEAEPHPGRLFAFWGLAVVLMTFGRAWARALCRRNRAYIQNAVIVGAGDVGQLVARKLRYHAEYGINLVGFVDADPRPRRKELGEIALLGPPENLLTIIDLLDVERVIIAFSNERHEDIVNLIRTIKDRDVQIDIVPRLFEVVGRGAGIHAVEGLPLVGLPALRLSHSSRVLKRLMDLTIATVGLIVLAPLFLFIAARIKRDSPGPVFFKQVRMGAEDKTFQMYKFRTMVVGADEQKHEVAHLNMHARTGGDPRMFKVPDDPRITTFGSFLRRYSLDELPQLINVIRGEMSLVGPRPLILDEDKHVPGWARKRLDLKPGMTGLWQVLGRSEIPFEEMTSLDYVYITNWSFWNDFALLFRTIPTLFRSRHAY